MVYCMPRTCQMHQFPQSLSLILIYRFTQCCDLGTHKNHIVKETNCSIPVERTPNRASSTDKRTNGRSVRASRSSGRFSEKAAQLGCRRRCCVPPVRWTPNSGTGLGVLLVIAASLYMHIQTVRRITTPTVYNNTQHERSLMMMMMMAVVG